MNHLDLLGHDAKGKSSKIIFPNGGLMVMNPMVQSENITFNKSKSLDSVGQFRILTGRCEPPLPCCDPVLTKHSPVNDWIEMVCL